MNDGVIPLSPSLRKKTIQHKHQIKEGDFVWAYGMSGYLIKPVRVEVIFKDYSYTDGINDYCFTGKTDDFDQPGDYYYKGWNVGSEGQHNWYLSLTEEDANLVLNYLLFFEGMIL